jgi:hypothetical protein
VAQQVRLRTGGGEGETDAGSGLTDAGPELKQAQSDRGELGSGERVDLRDGVGHDQHQPIGGFVQHKVLSRFTCPDYYCPTYPLERNADMRIPMTGPRFDIIPGYSAHHRLPSQADKLFNVERGPNWFVVRIGSLALQMW